MVDPAPNIPVLSDSARDLTQRLPKTVENYLRYLRIESCTPATLSNKERQLYPFLKWLESQGHSMDALDLGMFDILGHLEYMKVVRGNAANTIHTRHRALRSWCQWMTDWEIIPTNPVAKIKAPKLPKLRKPFISEEAFNSLLDLCPQATFLGARRAAMFQTLATTGIRRNELLMLAVGDIDWDGGSIRVVHGKGQKERSVPFLQECQRAMQHYIRQRVSPRRELWLTQTGQPMKHDGIGLDLRRMFQRAGLNDVPDVCHVFRRTFAANAERKGIPRAYIRAVLGWEDTQMLDRYVRDMESETQAIEEFKDKFTPFGRGKGKRNAG